MWTVWSLAYFHASTGDPHITSKKNMGDRHDYGAAHRPPYQTVTISDLGIDQT